MPYTNRTQTLLFSCRRNINFCLIRTLSRQKLNFDVVPEGVSSMQAVLKLRDASRHLLENYTDHKASTLQDNTPVLLLRQVNIIM